MKVILASQSKYRRALLEEHGIPITSQTPIVDEENLKTQLLTQQVDVSSIGLKLAEAKALSILKSKPEAIVIGCDQLCVFDNQILNKPGTIEKNILQLKKLSGHTHRLQTCVCILSQKHKVAFVDTTKLTMKTLSDDEIQKYVLQDQPMDCAGGYKFELHGHELFSEVLTVDPTAIQGLPIKQTLEILKKEFNVSF